MPELADMRVLTDPEGPLDKTVPAVRQITIEDLMTHRSGLAYAFSVPGPYRARVQQGLAAPGRDHWLTEVSRLPLVHQPAERLTYSHSTDVLGIVLSRIEGKSLQDVLAERIWAARDDRHRDSSSAPRAGGGPPRCTSSTPAVSSVTT